MTNFSFLKDKKEYTMFSLACIEAEKIYYSSPAMCAVGCRKALELAVKWVYSADNTIKKPFKDNLKSLIYEDSFRSALNNNTWNRLTYINKTGNLAVHTNRKIKSSDAVFALEGLFEFIEWIDYCYGNDYKERRFDENLIPKEKIYFDKNKIKEQQSLLCEKEAEFEALRKEIEKMSAKYTSVKENNKNIRKFVSKDLSEFETRKKYIDVDLKFMGWNFDIDIQEEYPVFDMEGVEGQKGFVDYVLFGKDGLPLALIEAKRTSKDPKAGRKQALLYADCLERKFKRRPIIFLTNGFETYFWDDKTSPYRNVSSIFSKDDLQKLIDRRNQTLDLNKVAIDDKITDRYYQKEAIRKVCENISKGNRKNLIVMATGTGKTRTASSLTDVLSRGKYVTNVLFLADRTALVKQAKDDFKNYLPHMSLCNLCTNKDDKNARIVFSTYPTILNAIDNTKTNDGLPLFTPAHFDLIIVDESHRSIFKKYRVIFEYFDSILLGLTATPKEDMDRNTYDFFEVAPNMPTYAYDYDTAVYKDNVLVPYYNYNVSTKFLDEGIKYADLSLEDKERYEADFIEDDGNVPDFIPSEKLNKFVFNENTVDIVLQDLMTRGIKVAGGDRIGKTIIFAQNKRHAEFILQRFNKLYPQYKGTFAQRVICEDSYAQSVIDDFKIPEKEPHIAVSVDMMDTGIDVPECVNLVFFKKVRSKVKFNQMIGRGTRLCKGLECIDQIDGEYTDKRRFLIFDYCGNFEFFGKNKNGYEAKETKTLTENIFEKQIRIAMKLQESIYIDEKYQNWRKELINTCQCQIFNLNTELIEVRLKRQYVEKYKKDNIFETINETNKGELIREIAPIVKSNDVDEIAKRFDNFMYGLMLAFMENLPNFNYGKKQLKDTASLLEKNTTITQIKEKLPIIKEINTDEFWKTNNVLLLENVRKELRSLIQFLDNGNNNEKIVITRLKDEVIGQKENVQLDQSYNFDDYREKVSRYVNEHSDVLAIYKLTHNIPLYNEDYKELERILTVELGSKEDYQREFGETPFGLLIRKIGKMNHQSAMNAFSKFINDESLNSKQIDFVHKIINYIEQNGYIDSVVDLQKPPFDKPVSFIKLFDVKTRESLLDTISSVKNNALNIIA